MRVFNRIAVILILIGLITLGAYVIAYSFDLFGYRLSSLIGQSGFLSDFQSDADGFVQSIEEGSLSLLTIAILAAIGLLGLVLLIAELKPPTPRLVKLQQGAYVTRGLVRREVTEAAEGTANVLGSAARVKARRRPGARVKLKADVRKGEDLKTIRSELREQVQQHLDGKGIQLSSLKLRLVESGPRETRSRVK